METMKNAVKLVLKGLFVIVLFTGLSITLSTVGVKSVSEAKAAASYQQVYQYLNNNGYTVVTLNRVKDQSSLDWISHTIKNGIHYWTTVHVLGNQIIDHTDIPL